MSAGDIVADFIDLQPSTVFAGDFRILKPLTQGGMGAVYVVEQISTGKQRALKLMLPQLVTDPTLRKRFEQEARVGALIESEHVVEVVGAGVDAATKMPWLAMELLSGDDLSHVVAQRGPLPPSEVLVLFEQLCHAVGAAHAAGIVHRDLKPENIFLARTRRAGEKFTVKVLDFGIAKIVAEAKTSRTAAIGSPIWMAPEQTDRAVVTPATDVWALGLIAFHLLTGRFYWTAANSEDATVPQLMREILFEPMPPASGRARELRATVSLPAGFDEWFIHCVSREPSARFQDAQQAFAHLRSVLSGDGRAHAATAPAPAKPIQRMERAAPVHVPVAATVDQPQAGAPRASRTGTSPAGSYTVGGKQTGERRGWTSPRRAMLAGAGVLALAIGAAAMLVVPSKGRIVVSVNDPHGASVNRLDVFIDGKKTPFCDVAPCTVPDQSAGSHEVKVLAEGFDAPGVQAVVVESRKDAVANFVVGSARRSPRSPSSNRSFTNYATPERACS